MRLADASTATDIRMRENDVCHICLHKALSRETSLANTQTKEEFMALLIYSMSQLKVVFLFFLRRPKGRRSNIALDLQFMQIFTNQKYS